MDRRCKQTMYGVVAAMVGAALCFSAPMPDNETPSRFDRDVAALCRTPHRLAGSAELAAAAEYVAAELRADEKSIPLMGIRESCVESTRCSDH